MGFKRHQVNRDLAEPSIVDALQKVGALVYRDLPVDLLIFYRGRFFCAEVKTPGLASHKNQRKRQTEFIEATGAPIVKTPLEAIAAITRGER